MRGDSANFFAADLADYFSRICGARYKERSIICRVNRRLRATRLPRETDCAVLESVNVVAILHQALSLRYGVVILVFCRPTTEKSW